MLSLSPISLSSSPCVLTLQPPPPSHHIHMARSLFKALTSPPPPLPFLSASRSRFLSARRQSSVADSAAAAAAAATESVQKIEDAIHGIVVRRSAPDWLPFVPGSSYWVPPRREGGYGIADLLDKLANKLTEEELMALTTCRGWPSSAFFLINHNHHNETSSIEEEEED